MNHYELLAIVTGRYAENEAEQIFGKIEDLIKKHTPVIHYRQNLDRKRLAYEINHQTHGYYFLVEFDAEPASLNAISKLLGLDKDIIRFQIIRRKTVGKPKTAERKQTLEQEAFGKRGAKVLGEIDILAETPVEVKETAAVEAPTVPAATLPTATDESASDDSKKDEVAPQEAAPVQAPVKETAEKESAEQTSRKKQKIDYTDLNKKLDDILNNDII